VPLLGWRGWLSHSLDQQRRQIGVPQGTTIKRERRELRCMHSLGTAGSAVALRGGVRGWEVPVWAHRGLGRRGAKAAGEEAVAEAWVQRMQLPTAIAACLCVHPWPCVAGHQRENENGSHSGLVAARARLKLQQMQLKTGLRRLRACAEAQQVRRLSITNGGQVYLQCCRSGLRPANTACTSAALHPPRLRVPQFFFCCRVSGPRGVY
jgi:hypothetical protein